MEHEPKQEGENQQQHRFERSQGPTGHMIWGFFWWHDRGIHQKCSWWWQKAGFWKSSDAYKLKQNSNTKLQKLQLSLKHGVSPDWRSWRLKWITDLQRNCIPPLPFSPPALCHYLCLLYCTWALSLPLPFCLPSFSMCRQSRRCLLKCCVARTGFWVSVSWNAFKKKEVVLYCAGVCGQSVSSWLVWLI